MIARLAPSLLGPRNLLLVRLVYRGLSTAAITAIGASVPYFSLFGGLIGSVSYWPLQVIMMGLVWNPMTDSNLISTSSLQKHHT